jgi:hypothetical protein
MYASLAMARASSVEMDWAPAVTGIKAVPHTAMNASKIGARIVLVIVCLLIRIAGF